MKVEGVQQRARRPEPIVEQSLRGMNLRNYVKWVIECAWDGLCVKWVLKLMRACPQRRKVENRFPLKVSSNFPIDPASPLSCWPWVLVQSPKPCFGKLSSWRQVTTKIRRSGLLNLHFICFSCVIGDSLECTNSAIFAHLFAHRSF